MPSPAGMISFLDHEVNSWQGLQILDTACGSGQLAQEMIARGANVTALECDPTVLAQAIEISRRQRKARSPYFLRGSPDDMPGEAASFQMILCLSNAVAALTSAESFQAFFARTALLLTPNGRLVLQLFNYDRILHMQDFTLEDISLPEEGILVQRHFQLRSDGMLDLVSNIRILRMDAYEVSTHHSHIYPITSDEIRFMLSESGFIKTNFYADVQSVEWQADSYSTIIIAVHH